MVRFEDEAGNVTGSRQYRPEEIRVVQTAGAVPAVPVAASVQTDNAGGQTETAVPRQGAVARTETAADPEVIDEKEGITATAQGNDTN
jgi:hypothetical protein